MFRLAARVIHPQVSHRCFAVFRFLNKGTATAAAAVRHRTMQSTTFSSSYSSFPPSLFSSATTRAAAATSRRVSSRSSNHGGGGGGGGRGAAVMLAAGSFIGWAKKVTNFQDEEDEDDEKERPPTPVLQAMLDAEKALAKEDLHGAEANYQLALDRMREHDPGAEVVVVLHDRLANIYHFQHRWDLAIVQYQAVAKGMSHHGREPTHPSLIELSLKLAECYARNGDRDTAQAGLTFAVDAARSNVETININTNTATTTATAPTAAGAADGYENVDARDNAVALYGMSLDALAMFLSEGGRHDAAANVYLKTLPVIASLSVDLQGSRLAAAHNKICSELTCAGAAPALALQHAADAVRYAEESGDVPEEEREVYRGNLLRLQTPPEAAAQ